MKARGILVVCAAILVIVVLVAGGCGSDEEARAELRAALEQAEQSLSELEDMGMETTVPQIKAIRDEMAPVWDRVVEAAREVEGADAAAAEQAWQAVDEAVSAIPDDANIMEALGVLGPMQNLIEVGEELKALVTPEE